MSDINWWSELIDFIFLILAYNIGFWHGAKVATKAGKKDGDL